MIGYFKITFTSSSTCITSRSEKYIGMVRKIIFVKLVNLRACYPLKVSKLRYDVHVNPNTLQLKYPVCVFRLAWLLPVGPPRFLVTSLIPSFIDSH